ncbi:FMRFamide receptor [Penaeus vannamei]|uniref:FMRFamide receptor n=1 Tax=Penaeus vannamei TaxID=6689 RepID=UPI00387F414F
MSFLNATATSLLAADTDLRYNDLHSTAAVSLVDDLDALLSTLADDVETTAQALTEGDYLDDLAPSNETDECTKTYSNISTAAPSLLRFILYGVLLTTIGLLGLAGNLISITILSRPKMRSSINCCLIGLTSFDMIVTTTSVLLFGLPEISEYTYTMVWYTSGVYQRVTPFVYPLGLIAQTGSVYLTVTVTVERYVAVCRPLRARSLCTYGRAKMYVLCVVLFSVLYNLPRFWEVTYKVCEFEDFSFVIVVPSKLRQNDYYKQVYIMWMYLLIMYLIPFLSLMIFNTFIYREVRAANQERQRLSRLEKKEIGLAVMLLVVVTVFFVCNVLAFIINVLELLDIAIDELTISSNLLVTVNSSVNFIIYCIFGQKFRKLFLKMFCSRILAASAARDTAMAESGAFANNTVFGESRLLTNGRSTHTFRLTSWNGSHQGRLLQGHGTAPGAHAMPCASPWRPSKYPGATFDDPSAPSTIATSSFNHARSPDGSRALLASKQPLYLQTDKTSERSLPGESVRLQCMSCEDCCSSLKGHPHVR